jgi:ElaB/YqjD/DUF883 family membrane-anchored ribosome-binding protein
MNTNMKKILKMALGTSLFLLDQSDRATKGMRERVSDQVDDLRDFAQDTYQTAAERVGRASQALTEEDNHAAWDTLRFVIGLGIGVGVGLLIAPANGEDTRTKLAEKAQEVGANLRQRFSSTGDKGFASTGD